MVWRSFQQSFRTNFFSGCSPNDEDKVSLVESVERSPKIADCSRFTLKSRKTSKNFCCRDYFPCFPARYVLSVMGFFGFVIVYALRVNMSVAIVAMANSTTERRTQNSSSSEGQCSPTAPRYRWTAEEQGWILSAFFYGYIVTQIPGGYLATRYSGKHIYGLGIFLTSALTLLTPLVSGLFSSIGPLVALRVSEGICEGVTFPAMFALLGKWAPPLEKSKMATICVAGAYAGNVISFPLTGYLCKCGFGGGWPSVFYIYGLVGITWYAFWLFLVYETPATHPRISHSERKYIQNAISDSSVSHATSTPWLRILTSWPVWGIVVAHFCTNWGYYTLLTCLPTYLKDTQKGVDIKSNGFLSGIPFLCQAVVAIIWGQITDFLRARGLPTVVARKFNQFLGMALPALFLLINSYFGTNIVLFVVFLSLAIGSVGFATSGYDCNHLDIAPHYAGVLMGITNTAATIPGILGPTVAKGIANADENETDLLRQQWRIVFFVTFAIYIVGLFVYTLLARGEEQAWANPRDRHERQTEPERSESEDEL